MDLLQSAQSTTHQILQLILSAIIPILNPIALATAHLETLLLSIFKIPRTTSFRMFAELPKASILMEPDDLAWLTLSLRLEALFFLMMVPYFVRLEANATFMSPCGRLAALLARRSRRAAQVIMLVRIWLLTAAWNAILIHFLRTTDFRILMVAAPFLTMLGI